MFANFDVNKKYRGPMGCQENVTPINIIFEGEKSLYCIYVF